MMLRHVRARSRGAVPWQVMLLPFLSTQLDPDLRKTYNFEYAVATARGMGRPEEEGAGAAVKKRIPRSESSFM